MQQGEPAEHRSIKWCQSCAFCTLTFFKECLFCCLCYIFVVDCLDPSCSNHGVCVNGECLCSPGWGGLNCELPRAQCPDQCSGHGTYLSDTGLCSCDPNWMGPDCSVGKKNNISVVIFLLSFQVLGNEGFVLTHIV